MTTITWDSIGSRYYENGISRGVFYGRDEVAGVAWNGLTSVDDDKVDTTTPLYFDGFKFGDMVTLGDFQGRLKAFTYPDAFLPYQGVIEADPGFSLTAQPKTRFGLCYRTEINNDLGQSIGYKLHILYNLLAIPAQKTYETLSLDNEPIDFEWDISAIPEEVDNFRPTAYVIIDSRKMDPFLLADIEDILYGTTEDPPKLPDLNELVSFVKKWGRLVITDNGDGTWTAYTPLPDIITMLDAESFQIVTDNAEYLDPDTYEISSSEKEEIWLP